MSTPQHLSPRTDDGLPCPLCAGVANRVVWHCAAWRVVHADSCAEEDFPAFYRLVSNAHHEEWTDLPEPLRQEGMAILACIETVLRQYLRPRKINLASLGNVVPHLHWHVIPRYTDDRHFPEPVWGQGQRPGVAHPAADAVALARAIDGALSAGH